MTDIANSAEIISVLRQTQAAMDGSYKRIETAQHNMPTSIEANLCEDDRNLLDSNFIRLKNLSKLNLPIVIGIGALVGICLMRSVMVSKSANDKRHKYEHRIKELDRWYKENVKAISFGQFYRENYPKKYREWQGGRWQ